MPSTIDIDALIDEARNIIANDARTSSGNNAYIVAHLLDIIAQQNANVNFQGPLVVEDGIALVPNPTGSLGSSSPFTAVVLGNQEDGQGVNGVNGGAILATRASDAAETPPDGAPFAVISAVDYNQPIENGLEVGGLAVRYGAAEGAVAATAHIFYASPTVEDTAPDTGQAICAMHVEGGLEVFSKFRLNSHINPTSLSADQNNYNPSGLASASALRLTASVPVNITGIVGGADAGRILLIVNIGANAITLVHQSGSSAAQNRFAFPGATNLVIPPDGTVTLWYDTVSGRYRSLAKNF